jgi:hypothetical protein
MAEPAPLVAYARTGHVPINVQDRSWRCQYWPRPACQERNTMSDYQVPPPSAVIDVIRGLAADNILIWLDTNGRLVTRPPGEFDPRTESMNYAWRIELTLAVYLDILRFRAGLEPLTPAAGNIVELSENLDDDGEDVLDALGSMKWAGSGTIDKSS